MTKRLKSILLIIILATYTVVLCSCVSQKQGNAKPKSDDEKPRVIATSMATTFIMDKLDVDLVAVPNSNLDKLPQRYEVLPKIGMAMSVDIEKVASLNPTYVFSPVSLISDLLPKYEAANIDYGFLNLNNVDGMYKSIADLGQLLDRKEQADALIKDYEDFMKKYRQENKSDKKTKVLVLMGFPGSYVVATPKSYVGSLVELAGGENVYDSDEQFINVSTEDMLKKDPDIILRAAHALPEDVKEMFKEEFVKNDIWKHFKAVENKKVYDLDCHKFGMSAKFNYKEALMELGGMLYEK